MRPTMTHSDPRPAASDDLFTDDDIHDAFRMLDGDGDEDHAGKVLVNSVLHLHLARVIAARALRQAADEWERSWPERRRMDLPDPIGADVWLRARADQIEHPT
jgi:hypothetical protein